MEYSLFHILWKTYSTLCGETLPQYVEEKFHGMWKSELCDGLQLIRRLFAANVSFVGSQRSYREINGDKGQMQVCSVLKELKEL